MRGGLDKHRIIELERRVSELESELAAERTRADELADAIRNVPLSTYDGDRPAREKVIDCLRAIAKARRATVSPQDQEKR